MSREHAHKSTEIHWYHAKQTVVLNEVRDLVRNMSEVVNKAHMYVKVMESEEPSSARQTL